MKRLLSITNNKEVKEEVAMDNELLKREKRLRRHAKRLDLKINKGRRECVIDKKVIKEKISGYMIMEEATAAVIAGWNTNGVYQLNLNQVETFLNFYEHLEAIKKLDLSIIGINIKEE